jgi:hypothetical protein
MGYAEEQSALMKEAHSAGDIKRAIQLAERLTIQLPNSEEAKEAKKLIDSLGVTYEQIVSSETLAATEQKDELRNVHTVTIPTSYGTAQFVGSMLVVIGWFVVACGPLAMVLLLTNSSNTLAAIAFGMAFVIAGLLVVAGGQLIRASADTADTCRAILKEMQRSN